MRDDIHLILDSVACAGETRLKDDPRVHTMYLVVRHGDQEWKDGEFPLEDLFALINKSGKMAQTSQPPVGEMVELFTSLVNQGKKLIFLTMSAHLSGTYQTAVMAAKQVMQDVKGSDIRVVDGNTCAAPIAGVAMEVMDMIDEGKSLDEIEAAANDKFRRTITFISVDTLEYLQKGGRIGRATAFLGSIFGIRPIISIKEDGVLSPADKCRTKKKMLKRMVELCAEQAPFECIYGANGLAEAEMNEVVSQLSEQYPGLPVLTTGIGSVLAAHLGPGVFAVFVRRKA